MVRLGIMSNEGDMDARLWSIVKYESMFGGEGGHATSVVKVCESLAGAKTASTKNF